MGRSHDRSYLWIFYLSAGFLFAGAVLRAPLVVEGGSVLVLDLFLLLAWLALFVSEYFVSRLWPPWTPIYLGLQTAIVVLLLLQPGSYDFFAVLFGVLAMQAFHRHGLWIGAAWVTLFVPLTAVTLLRGHAPAQVATFVLIYLAVNVFLGLYVLIDRRAANTRLANEALGRDLEAANAELRAYAEKIERLAVAKERNRVARELHDSVTQTIFSMTLASQSAAILLGREPAAVDAQLERLRQLTQSALSEMHVLISELAPDRLAQGGFLAAIREDTERRAQDGVRVSLEIEEAQPAVPAESPLSVAEEQGLLRIAQEALNNVVKHSGAREAVVRLRLQPPPRMEIEDRGQGFDVEGAREGSGIGLAGMRERAGEIGWKVAVESSVGKGTRIVVEPDFRVGG